ncbi:MAG TPA: hypothetical protein VFZ34_07505 [Blastocatellia bacterium]|nr:hypothetical protein [Blastocatellia bacterium]
MTISPTTWNVIGLDSNNTAAGPDVFPAGARVCNTSGASINNVLVTFVWDSSNIYINLEAGNTINVGTLAANTCRDYYFLVRVTRTSAAYNAKRSYHITASGDGATTVSTPTPREIYVERLVSQNRNSINAVSGPTTVYVGNTYTFTLNADTATNGYEQLEAFLPFSASIFEVTSISTSYTAPSGGSNTKFYADACGWDNVPSSSSYRSCIGPVQYSGGKAGGTIATTYTVRVIGTGSSVLSALVYDFSGSSYHYNSDYGSQTLSVTALNPADMTIAKSHTGNFTQGQTGATYQITATNSGGIATSGTVTVTDTLPTGLTPTGASGTGWTCSIASQTVTCTRSDVLAASASYPVITLTVNVSSSAAASITNQATVSGGNETNTANNTASDPTTINPGPPNVELTKAVSPTGLQAPDTDLTYTITFTNSGNSAAQQITILDPVPDNTDFKLGSGTTSLGTTGLTMVIEYSSDYSSATPGSATWTYSPTSGGGSASPGYDRNVRAIRWRVTVGSLSPTSPNNSGNVGFTVKIR